MLKVGGELFLREFVEEFGLGGSIDLANAVDQLLFVHSGKYRQTALFSLADQRQIHPTPYNPEGKYRPMKQDYFCGLFKCPIKSAQAIERRKQRILGIFCPYCISKLKIVNLFLARFRN
jgi:hypothetical protein